LKIKSFIGNSENALMTQIYAALITYLLLCYFK
jgi:IS4 transposase